ncbi:MAG TPA: hypothetical protein VF287_07010 [Usitatibacter sp.]
MDFENLDLNPPISTDRIYVSWSERWDIPRYVDNYLRERKLRLDDGVRAKICDHIGRYPYKGVLKKADLDDYLDTQTADLKAEAAMTEPERNL